MKKLDCGRFCLLTQGQLNDPSLNSIDQNHNNLGDNGGHSLMMTRQIPTKAGNVCDILALRSQEKSCQQTFFYTYETLKYQQLSTTKIYQLTYVNNVDQNCCRKHG